MGWNPFKSVKKAAQKAGASISSGVKKANRWTNNAAKEMHLHSIKQSFDVKTLVTDPKQFAKDAFGSVKQDVQFAGKFFQNFYSGNWAAITKEGSADTIAAFKGKSSDDLSKKEQELVTEAETAGAAASAYYRGDYEGFLKALEQSQIGLVSDGSAAALKAMEEAGVAQEAYEAYKRGDYAAMNAALQKSQIGFVSDAAKKTEQAAAYAGEAQRLKSAYDTGGADAAISAGKESEVGFISDLAGYAEQGKSAYDKASAAYDQSKKLDTGALAELATKEGARLMSDSEYRKKMAGKADAALAMGMAAYKDRMANHPKKQEAKRSVERLTAGAGSPPEVRRVSAAPAGGLGDIINQILRAFGLG